MGLQSPEPRSPGTMVLLERIIGEALGPLVRTDRTPGWAARLAQASIDDIYFAAFRKRGDDTRLFDHFVPF